MRFRGATRDDLETIITLLREDDLGREREAAGGDPAASYVLAFEEITSDSRNELIVAEDESGAVVGTFQITYIPSLTYQGAERAQIEGVRVAGSQRGRGLGKSMISHAIEMAKERGCGIVQLTSDRRREDAIRFYEKLGFTASHAGMKVWLD